MQFWVQKEEYKSWNRGSINLSVTEISFSRRTNILWDILFGASLIRVERGYDGRYFFFISRLQKYCTTSFSWKIIWKVFMLTCYVFGPPAEAGGRVLWNRVSLSYHLTFCLSFCLFFHLSGHFLGIVSLVFSKFWYGARNPIEVVNDRVGFSRKKIFAPKIGKMDKKWSKSLVFRVYWKILSLIFMEFVP